MVCVISPATARYRLLSFCRSSGGVLVVQYRSGSGESNPRFHYQILFFVLFNPGRRLGPPLVLGGAGCDGARSISDAHSATSTTPHSKSTSRPIDQPVRCLPGTQAARRLLFLSLTSPLLDSCLFSRRRLQRRAQRREEKVISR